MNKTHNTLILELDKIYDNFTIKESIQGTLDAVLFSYFMNASCNEDSLFFDASISLNNVDKHINFSYSLNNSFNSDKKDFYFNEIVDISKIIVKHFLNCDASIKTFYLPENKEKLEILILNKNVLNNKSISKKNVHKF